LRAVHATADHPPGLFVLEITHLLQITLTGCS